MIRRLNTIALLGAVLLLAGCDSATSTDATLMDPFLSVSAGGDHSCAVVRSGRIWCWGSNENGQLGDRTKASSAELVRSDEDQPFTAVSAGLRHTCALTADGTVYCWGWNFHGQLGHGTSVDVNFPLPVVGNQRFTAISSGWLHTCGLADGGAAYCWGVNGQGQLGDGTTVDRNTPVRAAGNLSFASISAGSFHTCGLTTGGQVYCWGLNHLGQLGDGTTESRSTAALVAGNLSFTRISAGLTHTCAIAAGKGYCWGSNGNGELGNQVITSGAVPGATTPQPVFHAGATAGGFTDIVAGTRASCAISARVVFCWGDGVTGLLGPGILSSRSTPQRVESADEARFARLSVGAGEHACGLTTASGVYCWGRGEAGALGANSTGFSAAPVRVPAPERSE